jgi:hypothetical protein
MPRGSYSSKRGRLESTPSGGSGGRRAIFVAFALATLVGTGAVFLTGLVGRSSPPEAGRGKAEAAKLEAGKAAGAPDVVQLPVETRAVRILSEPGGARVFDGPRLVGEAPVELRLPVDSPGVSLTLVREGRMDLTYLVRPSDAPEITLRLLPVELATPPSTTHPAHPAVRTAGKGPGAATSVKPKVEIIDDAIPSTRPKVDALDD